nr:MAG TPA: hypothetical protein [Caudoviricetes sp.]
MCPVLGLRFYYSPFLGQSQPNSRNISVLYVFLPILGAISTQAGAKTV